MKIEYSYRGQNTYLSYHNSENTLLAITYLERLMKGYEEPNINNITHIKVPLSNLLWISIYRNEYNYFIFDIMIADYKIGNLDKLQDVYLILKEFSNIKE
jgi:hypothetical protein